MISATPTSTQILPTQQRTSRHRELGAGYAELRNAVIEAGLLDRAYAYYATRFVVYLVIFAAALAIPFLRPTSLLWLTVAAIVLGVANVQLGLIGHDSGHLAVFRGSWANRALGSFLWSLVLGVGFWWWSDRHNRHHAHTNDTEEDPELFGGGVIAFTEEDVLGRQGWRRTIIRHQAVFPQSIAVMSTMVTFAFRVDSWLYAFRRLRGPRRLVEMALLASNHILYALPVFVLGWTWVGVYVVSQMVSGVYLAMIVAPNHKGMPVWAQGVKVSFVEQQVLSSRNIDAHPLWDWMFGGLNYQIEHHLFPNMARAKFNASQALVKRFCADYGLDYDEVSPAASYRAVFDEMRRVGELA